MNLVGNIEATRDWFNASYFNKEEIDRYFIENNGSDSSHETFQILTPVMTSNTDPSGIVSASSHRDGQSLEYYVFRQITPPNNIGCWCNIQSDTDRWLQYEFEEPVVVDYLRIWTPYYTDYTRICSPKKFVLKGSNDGTTWTDIQTFTGIDDVLLTEYDFDVENSTAYLMYRIKFTETWDQYDTYVGIGRLDFCKKVSAPIKTIPYDLMIVGDQPEQMVKLVGQTSGKVYNLCLAALMGEAAMDRFNINEHETQGKFLDGSDIYGWAVPFFKNGAAESHWSNSGNIWTNSEINSGTIDDLLYAFVINQNQQGIYSFAAGTIQWNKANGNFTLNFTTSYNTWIMLIYTKP